MTEAQEQKLFVQWFRKSHPKLSRSLRVSLNGSLGHGAKAARRVSGLKGQGFVTGESDIFIAVPASEFHGLFIEMKVIGGVVSPEQRDYLTYMRNLGYATAICYSGNEAIAEFKAYYRGSLKTRSH